MAESVEVLLEIEQIRQLKYRYFRAIDTHDWALFASCLAEDVTTQLDSGNYAFVGRDAFIAGLRQMMDRPTLLSKHQGHHPEIELVAADRALGVWYLEDQVIDLDNDWIVQGTAFYQDEYIKRDGAWLILSTGYRRVLDNVTTPIPADFRVVKSWFGVAG